jgi:hypothetical protein
VGKRSSGGASCSISSAEGGDSGGGGGNDNIDSNDNVSTATSFSNDEQIKYCEKMKQSSTVLLTSPSPSSLSPSSSCLVPDGALVVSEGKGFPVEIRYLGTPRSSIGGSSSSSSTSLKVLCGEEHRRRVEEGVADAIMMALKLEPNQIKKSSMDQNQKAEEEKEEEDEGGQEAGGGDVLAFLPGEAEIRGVLKCLERRLAEMSSSSNSSEEVELLPLYGALPQAAQLKAVGSSSSPHKRNSKRRKV